MPTSSPTLAKTSPKLPCKLQLCVKMHQLSSYNGVDWMKRRTKQRMTAIHVSIPVRILEDFDQDLKFNQSRSKKITMLMAQSLLGDVIDLYSDATLGQIIRKLVTFEEIDDTLASLLLQVLSKSP
jgi:hypothetical protein